MSAPKKKKKKFYADWTQGQVLALVLKGIRNRRFDDQTILSTDEGQQEVDMAPLSEIIIHVLGAKL